MNSAAILEQIDRKTWNVTTTTLRDYGPDVLVLDLEHRTTGRRYTQAWVREIPPSELRAFLAKAEAEVSPTEPPAAIPYLRAHAAYHAGGAPVIPWKTALDFHLQAGFVIATAGVFLMGRRVTGLPDHLHPTLTAAPDTTSTTGNTWHLWACAGDPFGMLSFTRTLGARDTDVITWQRGTRSPAVHAWPLSRIRHAFHREGRLAAERIIAAMRLERRALLG